MGGPGSLFSYGSGWANACNTPWRFYKHFVHEGGISTPLIVHWPAGMKRSGEIDHRMGHIIDIMATCADAAGAAYPRRSTARRLLPWKVKACFPPCAANRLGKRTLFWEHEHNRAVRDGKWKLVAIHGRAWELYDMDADRAELHNLAAEHPDIAGRLAEEWRSLDPALRRQNE